MKSLAKWISLVSLIAVIVPSLLFFAGAVDHNMVKWTALLGTISWFIATPLWMGRELSIDAAEVEM
jgi:hypothetical protein